MGTKDKLTKKYMKNPKVFADFFNGFIYEGEQIIDADSLEELDATGIVSIPYSKGNKSVAIQRIRDLVKSTIVKRDNSRYYMILGIENQSDIHYAMPVKKMMYDALTYADQIDAISKQKEHLQEGAEEFLSGIGKTDHLIPVVTVTLYWGDKPWDGPTSLKEMLVDMDEDIDRLVDDCNINLFSIIDLVEIPEYRTELKELFAVLNARNDGEKLVNVVSSSQEYMHISKDAAEIIKNFSSMKKLPRRNKEGDYNMCKAIIEIEEKGIEKGTCDTLISLVKDGLLDIKEAAKRADMPLEKFKSLVEKNK